MSPSSESSVLLSLHTPCFILLKSFSVAPLMLNNCPSQLWVLHITLWWRFATITRSLLFPYIANLKAIQRLHKKYDTKVAVFAHMSKCMSSFKIITFSMSVGLPSHLFYKFYYFTVMECFPGWLPPPLCHLILSHPNFPCHCSWL